MQCMVSEGWQEGAADMQCMVSDGRQAGAGPGRAEAGSAVLGGLRAPRKAVPVSEGGRVQC